MSDIGRALDAMPSLGIESHATRSKNQSELKNEGVVEPENLSAMDLVYAVFAEEGDLLVGSPSAGFAYFVESSDTLVVVSADSKKIKHVPVERVMATDAMVAAQELGATFMIFGNQAICNIKGISQVGSSYSEAALRAILAYVRLEKSGQTSNECVLKES